MPASDGPRLECWTVAGLAAAHAALFAAAFPPIGLWPLIVVCLVPLTVLALRARSLRSSLVAVAITQVLMWLWLDRWLIHVTVPGYLAKCVYMSVYPVAFVWILRRVSAHRRLGRLPLALVVPVVWVGLECARGEVVFSGYPWYLLAHPLIGAEILVQSADLLGTYLPSFLAAAVAGAFVDVLCRATRPLTPRALGATLATVAVVNAANVAYGVAALRRYAPARSGAEPPAFLVIQTNLPQSNKVAWTAEAQARDVPTFIDLTREAYAAVGGEVDLILWPETMVPGLGLEPSTIGMLEQYARPHEPFHQWGDALVELSRELGVSILAGSPAWIDPEMVESKAPDGRPVYRMEPRRTYNSAYLIQGRAPYQRYDKHHLTPFGEEMPYISRWPWLEERLLSFGAPGMSFSLDRNPDISTLVLKARDSAVTLATPICFEDTMARVCRRMVYADGVKRVDVLANLSNDGWFGDSVAGREQHVQIARFRSIENRVPMVRCANTGLSVSIEPTGRVAGAIGDGRYGQARRSGWLLARPAIEPRATLYGRVGEILPFTCLALTLAALLGSFAGSRTIEDRMNDGTKRVDERSSNERTNA